LPVLLTAAERLIRPIKVKEPQLEAGRAKPILEITATDLSADTSIFGCAGSPTWVDEIRSLARSRVVEMIEGSNAEEKAARLIARLESLGVLSDNTDARDLA
jgi:electron transfer flavoprotein alpha/beta subunit